MRAHPYDTFIRKEGLRLPAAGLLAPASDVVFALCHEHGTVPGRKEFREMLGSRMLAMGHEVSAPDLAKLKSVFYRAQVFHFNPEDGTNRLADGIDSAESLRRKCLALLVQYVASAAGASAIDFSALSDLLTGTPDHASELVSLVGAYEFPARPNGDAVGPEESA